MLIDEHIPEVEEFRNHFTAMYGFDAPRSGYLSASSVSDRVVAPVLKISKLMWLKEAKGYRFYGKINSVSSRDVWSYLGCAYTERVQPDGGEYLCDKEGCNRRMEKLVDRYRLMLEVKDKDGNCCGFFFDELCRRILGKGALELQNEMYEADEMPKQILDLEGKCYLSKISHYSCVNDGARDWYRDSLCDDPSTVVEYSQDDEFSSEESEDDENLDLLLGNTTQGDSIAPTEAPLNADADSGLTPSSKRRRDDGAGGAPDTWNSSNLKLKSVKLEKP